MTTPDRMKTTSPSCLPQSRRQDADGEAKTLISRDLLATVGGRRPPSKASRCLAPGAGLARGGGARRGRPRALLTRASWRGGRLGRGAVRTRSAGGAGGRDARALQPRSGPRPSPRPPRRCCCGGGGRLRRSSPGLERARACASLRWAGPTALAQVMLLSTGSRS